MPLLKQRKNWQTNNVKVAEAEREEAKAASQGSVGRMADVQSDGGMPVTAGPTFRGPLQQDRLLDTTRAAGMPRLACGNRERCPRARLHAPAEHSQRTLLAWVTDVN